MALVKQDGLQVTEHAQELDYDYWPADHILRVRALPPRGLQTHILHGIGYRVRVSTLWTC